ncbi:MAG: hypothetical protein MZV63_62215 [Marinilabiliales bacterium]|nr:hypothetical protein [Marinilabiliales bacterium]
MLNVAMLMCLPVEGNMFIDLIGDYNKTCGMFFKHLHQSPPSLHVYIPCPVGFEGELKIRSLVFMGYSRFKLFRGYLEITVDGSA